MATYYAQQLDPLSMSTIARYLPLLAAMLTMPANAGELAGRVVNIADGDTLTLLVDRQQVRVRLADIDAPERKQAFGNRSRQSLHELCHGRAALVQENGQDRYGRTIGQVKCAGIDANAEQIRRGMAWVYARYARKDSPLYALQDQAKESRTGLWADAHPLPPWEWRQSTKN